MSILQKQLAAIAASSTHQLDLKAQKAAHGKSLLFEPSVAASQSFDALYALCYEGYRELCALDSRFLSFSRSIFGAQSKAEDRTQMTEKENGELDQVLEAFITLVGPRLLLKPAEKALEWLVRRFRVHEYNTEILALVYLPYHSTPQFLALLSILPSSPPPTLRFLFPYIASLSNPPRQTIVYTAVNTPAFFVALQGYVVKALQAGHHSSGLLSFWSGVTTQAIDAILDQWQSGMKTVQNQRREELLIRILPTLNEALKYSGVAEAVMGCYMIIIILVTKGAFEDKVLNALMEAVVRSQEPETLEDCLMCLAVVAEERSQASLPRPVAKRLLKTPQLTQHLRSLSTKCRVERLALGSALATLENKQLEERRQTLQEILVSNLLDDSQTSHILSAALHLLRISSPGSAQHGQLIDCITLLNEVPAISQVLQPLLKGQSAVLGSLGLLLDQPLAVEEESHFSSEDEVMLDADQDVQTVTPPSTTVSTFLGESSEESFQLVLAAFEQAVASASHPAAFLAAKELGQAEAFKKPLYLSFLGRAWCSHTSTSVRIAALKATILQIRKLETGMDLQNLIPYLICALADRAPTVRRAAAVCVSTLAERTSASQDQDGSRIWGSSDLYGKASPKIDALAKGQTANLLSSLLVPILEECVMDSRFILSAVKEALGGGQSSKSHSQYSLKKSLRDPLLSFLGSHVAVTPSLPVRLCLLPLFAFSSKAAINLRTNTIIPLIRGWCSLSATDVKAKCTEEKVTLTNADNGHFTALIPRESETIDLVRDILLGNANRERTQLLDTTFDWLKTAWSTLRSTARLALSECLLDLALKDHNPTAGDELCRTRSLELLRNVNLDTDILLSFIRSIPSTTQMPEGPAKKRRRTSRSEMARIELRSTEDVSRVLGRLTMVLELLEASNPGEHPALFKDLFTILGDLQQLRQQSGSDLVYLQSLILGALTPMVNKLKTEKSTEYQTAIHVDLLINCIRHSNNPQVQNASLLLIASLATWVPELVLLNLMPIFTFIGSALLHQTDDYSAHVVDQTISRVVPQLARSLRTKHRDFLTGVSDLLLSFTAAFEHMPQHRRLKLFSELARTLGPEDSLSAIIALLVDRHPTSTAQRKFIPELLLQFPPVATLEAFKGYLHLIADAVSERHKISDALFSLNEKQPVQIDNTVNILLSALAELATNKVLHGHVGKAFRKSRDPTKARALFANIVDTTIQLSKKVTQKRKLHEACNQILANCLALLPTVDLVKTAELILANPDHQVQIAVVKSIEVRAGSVTQNDHLSVSSLLAFLPRANDLLQQSSEVEVAVHAISCMDCIIERFGKKDVSIVTEITRTLASTQALASKHDRLRVLSLICLTSAIGVLEEEAIALLPTVLPIAFEYLRKSIENRNQSLHNAVFELLSNIVQRLSFIFSREYLTTAIELSQRSAAAELNEACDKNRQQFYQIVSIHITAQEAFTAMKATWASALGHGFKASHEQLNLVLLTIENQPKAGMIKARNALFSLFLETFTVRGVITSFSDPDTFKDDELLSLEESIIEAVITMTIKLNDTTFRPFFVQLVDVVGSIAKDDVGNVISITFCRFLAAFFDRFKSIVTSYSSYVIEHTERLLKYLAGRDDEGVSELREATLSALQKSFQYDQDGFWQSPSHYNSIMPVLLQQLTVAVPLATTETAIIPAITELATASSASVDNHRAMNAIMFKYMRAEEAHIRLATVKCEQGLTKRLGEEWLSMLPEMLPFISELREDDDEIVERETQKWINMMEEMTGEDLEGMLQ